jgi:bacterioferritin B
MLIGKKLNAAINTQVGNELGASHQYVQVAAYFDSEALPVLAAHFYKQADEERMHAMKLAKYVVDAGGDLKIPAIVAPRTGFKNALEAVTLSLTSELKVTAQINDLVNIAIAEKDHLAKQMLDWFVNEQLEEVSSMDTLVRMVKRAGESGLFHVERFLKDGGLADSEADAEGAAD